MYNKSKSGLIKHADFLIIDLVCLVISCLLSYYMLSHTTNAYSEQLYQDQIIILIVVQLLIVLFASPYKNILKRDNFQELKCVIQNTVTVLILNALYLFAVHQIGFLSRRYFIGLGVSFFVLSLCGRIANKKRIFRKRKDNKGRKSLVIFTRRDMADEVIRDINDSSFHEYKISGIVLMGRDVSEETEIQGIPAYGRKQGVLEEISHEWVDEVLFYLPPDMALQDDYVYGLTSMGITVHYALAKLNVNKWGQQEVGKVGNLHVLTSSLRIISTRDVILKRLIDVVGGLVGCAITGIIFIFVAPAIYHQSPGPIFFSQERIGKNGKTFRMYKFRSMYPNAEKRKKEYMKKNRISDGMMFKMDDDPRIIGSEKKDKNGKPKGIGNFIRKTSLDEFPQFWNVLKGDMSLVGTRPPTLDEWEKYDRRHRVRMSIKPGITGLWQVSGRSKITDFEEVVKLDTEYIKNWSWGLDIKILLKTIVVVFRRDGAE